MAEQTKIKVDNNKLNKYYFYLNNNDDAMTMVKVYASTIVKAAEIMKAQFPDGSFINLEPIGSLIEHGKDIYRKNLITKHNG